MKKGGKRSGRKNPKVFYLNWIGIREVCRRIGFLGWKLNALEEKKKGGDGANAFFWFNSMISTIIIILLLFIFIFSLLFFWVLRATTGVGVRDLQVVIGKEVLRHAEMYDTWQKRDARGPQVTAISSPPALKLIPFLHFHWLIL